jgi:hypothetical protein
LGVLVVEEVDQPARRRAECPCLATHEAARGQWCVEVLAEAPAQGSDDGRVECSVERRWLFGSAGEQQVVSQSDPVAGSNGFDLVPAVRVERDQSQLRPRPAVGDGLALVVDDQGAAAEGTREEDDQGADHVVGLLRVLVRGEELSRTVDQQGVELGLEPRAVGQTQLGTEVVERREQGSVPPPPVDPHPALGDLPAVTHRGVEQGLLTLSVVGGTSNAAKGLRLGCGHR